MSEQYAVKIGKLLTSNPEGRAGFSDAFIYEPHDFDEKRYGSLYFVIEIASPAPEASEIGKSLTKVIQEEYYKNMERDPELSFEIALKKANRFLGDLAEQGEVFWLGKINAIVACLHENKLFVTAAGAATANVLRGEDLNDISEGLAPQSEKPDPLKTFGSVISGDLYPGDKLIFSTPGLFYKITPEKLSRIIREYSPPTAVGNLVAYLDQEEDALGLSILILEIQTQKAASEEPLEAAAQEVWLEKPENKFEKFKEKAKPILAKIGAFLVSVGTIISTFWKNKIVPAWKKMTAQRPSPERIEKIQSAAEEVTNHAHTESHTQDNIYKEETQKHANRFLNALGPGLKDIFNFFKNIFSDVRGLKVTDIKEKSNKKYLLIFIICLVLLISSVVFMKVRQGQIELTEKYKTAFEEAKHKEGEGMQYLVTHDRAKAKTSFEAAKLLLQQLQGAGYNLDEVNALLAQVEKELNQAEGIVQVAPKELADFSGLEPNLSTTSLVYGDNNKYYTLNSQTNKIYFYSNKENKTDIAASEQGTPLKFLAKSKDAILAYDDSPAVWKLSSSGEDIIKVTLPTGASWEKATDISYYQTSLYVLNSEEGKIYKHWPTYSGYSKAFDYAVTSDKLNLKNAEAISISEFVYVLCDNGNIYKLSQGQPESGFKIKNLSTAFKNPTDMYTEEGFSYIYIADPENKRIVTLDATGNFQKQYTSDQFSQINGMYISEKTKKGYIMSGNKLYQFGM